MTGDTCQTSSRTNLSFYEQFQIVLSDNLSCNSLKVFGRFTWTILSVALFGEWFSPQHAGCNMKLTATNSHNKP